MWRRLAVFILKFRVVLLLLLLAVTAVMAYFAKGVQVTNEFNRAVPLDNPKYVEYRGFLKKFGEDGNTLVVGVQTKAFFQPTFFIDYQKLVEDLQKVNAVQGILSVPTAVYLTKDSLTDKLVAKRLFYAQTDSHTIQRSDVYTAGDSSWRDAATSNSVSSFQSLPFYNGALWNPQTGAYLMAVRINKDTLNTARREVVVAAIQRLADSFGKKHHLEIHYSGLPLIRTVMATQVQSEIKLFVLLSFILTAVILALFFRSWVAVVSSILVVGIAVVWALGTVGICGYQLSLLTGLIPSLIVVIGIPNCVYFLNKYHTEYAKTGDKREALLEMVGKMGIVTLFTNLTAAIGFGVFFFTKSLLLREFGLVAGLNLIAIFFISLILLPVLFSFLPPPRRQHTNYLESGWIHRLLGALTNWTFNHRPIIYAVTVLACAGAAIGAWRLRKEGHIVDDLPKSGKVYQDLKFFENNFGGVMPLEMVINAKKKYGATLPKTLQRIDSFITFLKSQPEIGNVLAVTEGIKFAYQAYSGGDSSFYILPDGAELQIATASLRKGTGDTTNSLTALLNAFIDTSKKQTRISVSTKDIGSVQLPLLIGRIQQEETKLFPREEYDSTTYTGTQVVFLEGSKFIINSLTESLIYAFIMILGCMIVLFRDWRVVLIALVVNIVPLLMTAGLMGWAGVPLKPSTVLVFSVALGITVDVTIRFLVNYGQELPRHNYDIRETVRHTIQDTGLSIIYTSLVLIAGFGVFILSQFDGTKSLGTLTSVTLLLAMVANLTLQPALLLWMAKGKK